MAQQPTSRPEIISMDFSTGGRDDCYYRILANAAVKYITVNAGTLDADSLMDMPLEFETILPPLPYYEDHWTQARISHDATTGKLTAELSAAQLPGVQEAWHPEMINFLDMKKGERLSLLAAEYTWTRNGQDIPVVAKMARFAWEITYMKAETHMYKILSSLDIGPRFLGHIHENGRVIGFALEKLAGRRHAGPGDLATCQAALRRLHAHGILHGDVSRYNFLIDLVDGTVVMIDFEKTTTGAAKEALDAEEASLEAELAEETGRGGGYVDYLEEDE